MPVVDNRPCRETHLTDMEKAWNAAILAAAAAVYQVRGEFAAHPAGSKWTREQLMVAFERLALAIGDVSKAGRHVP